MGPQAEVSSNGSGMSPQDAESCRGVLPRLVAPRRTRENNPELSMRKWLAERLGVPRGSCIALAAKLIRGKQSNGSPVTGPSIRNFCADHPADVVLKFFEDLEIDRDTAERIRVGPAKTQADASQSTRKKRQHVEVPVDEAADALASKQPRVQSTHQYETLGPDDASAQMTDAAAGARLALPQPQPTTTTS